MGWSSRLENWLKNQRFLHLTPSLCLAVQKGLERFEACEGPWAESPHIQDSWLLTSPLALPFVLHYADPADCSEFEWERFRRQGRSFLEHRFANASSRSESRALACALSNFEGL